MENKNLHTYITDPAEYEKTLSRFGGGNRVRGAHLVGCDFLDQRFQLVPDRVRAGEAREGVGVRRLLAERGQRDIPGDERLKGIELRGIVIRRKRDDGFRPASRVFGIRKVLDEFHRGSFGLFVAGENERGARSSRSTGRGCGPSLWWKRCSFG